MNTDAIAKKFREMRDRSAAFQAEWDEWARNHPNSVICEIHEAVLPPDVETSVRTSWTERRMVIVYKRCEKCAADDALRLRSTEFVRCGVPEVIAHASFDNFICRTQEDGENLSSARRFAAAQKGFLVLLGSVGNGKSHLAVAVARALGCRFRFITQAGLLKKLRDTYRNDKAEDVVEACKRVRLLILDEVGLSVGGKDEFPMLHEILAERHNSKKPTVITTNLDREALEEVLGERLTDRLTQSGFKLLKFSGESLRRNFRKEY